MTDHFAKTQYTWIASQVRHGNREQVARHVMELYERPLRYYLMALKLTPAERDEIDDILNGFFLSRLQRDDFMAKWLASELKLRRWLMNALHFHIKERRRTTKRRREEGIDNADVALGDGDPAREMDRAVVMSFVQHALEKTREHCAASGLEQHYELFIGHQLHGRPLTELAPDHDITPERAAVMSRTARRHFVTAVHDAFKNEGVAEDEISGEICALIDSAQPNPRALAKELP